MLLVLDASVAVAASHNELGFARLGRHELIAPPLMRVEASSVLHELAWRGQLTADHARTMLDRMLRARVEIRDPPALPAAAWRLADELGWAKKLSGNAGVWCESRSAAVPQQGAGELNQAEVVDRFLVVADE